MAAWSTRARGGGIWAPGGISVADQSLFVATGKARGYALKVQDRVIRLEERLRFASLLPEPLRSQSLKLNEAQLIALRFASDEEAPGLVQRALSENLSNADIKRSIKTWRPDLWRA